MEKKTDFSYHHGQDQQLVNSLIEEIFQSDKGGVQVLPGKGIGQIKDRALSCFTDDRLHIFFLNPRFIACIGNQFFDGFHGTAGSKTGLFAHDHPCAGSQGFSRFVEDFSRRLHYSLFFPVFDIGLKKVENPAFFGYDLENLFSFICGAGSKNQVVPFREAAFQNIQEPFITFNGRSFFQTEVYTYFDHSG